MDRDQFIWKQRAHDAIANLIETWPANCFLPTQIIRPDDKEFDVKRAFPVLTTQIGLSYEKTGYKEPFGNAIAYDRVAKQLRKCQYKEQHEEQRFVLSRIEVIPDNEWESIARSAEQFYHEALAKSFPVHTFEIFGTKDVL
jgi:hypothetical protein